MLKTMRRVTLGILAAALALSAAEPILGTWKLNSSKSKYSPGPGPKSATQVYSQDGDWFVVKADTVNAEGKTVNTTNRYRGDGKEYPYESAVTGPGKISVKKIDDHHFESVIKSNSGSQVTIHSTISKDGKTRTLKMTGVNAKGEKVNNVAVYEKQ